MDKTEATGLVVESIENLVLLLGTQNGYFLGYATDDGEVLFRDITKPDTDDPLLTKLLNSDETTKIYTLVGSRKVVYGFECAEASVSISNVNEL